MPHVSLRSYDLKRGLFVEHLRRDFPRLKWEHFRSLVNLVSTQEIVQVNLMMYLLLYSIVCPQTEWIECSLCCSCLTMHFMYFLMCRFSLSDRPWTSNNVMHLHAARAPFILLSFQKKFLPYCDCFFSLLDPSCRSSWSAFLRQLFS